MFHSPSLLPALLVRLLCIHVYLSRFFLMQFFNFFFQCIFLFFPLFSTWEFFTRQRKRGQNYATPSPSVPSSLCLFVDLSGSSSISNYKIIIISSCSIDKFPICFSSCRFQFRLIEFYFLLLFFLWLIKIILFTLY